MYPGFVAPFHPPVTFIALTVPLGATEPPSPGLFLSEPSPEETDGQL